MSRLRRTLPNRNDNASAQDVLLIEIRISHTFSATGAATRPFTVFIGLVFFVFCFYFLMFVLRSIAGLVWRRFRSFQICGSIGVQELCFGGSQAFTWLHIEGTLVSGHD